MKDNFSNRLKQALEIREMSAAELARLSDTPESVISQYKKGMYEPKQRRLDKFSKILNVSIDWLMGYDVPMEKENNSPEKSEELEEGIILHRNGKTSTYRLSKEKLKTVQALLEQLNDEDDEEDL